jgi:hypothetical protein
MRAITIRFSVQCPHCSKKQIVEALSNGEIDGAALEECKGCHQPFVIGWSIEIGVDVFKCDAEPAEVDCTYSLSEGWDPDDPEEE